MLSSAPDKAKLFAKNVSKNSSFDDSDISFPVFPSRTNLKLHNIYLTSMMVKKGITKLNSSKASGPDCIPVVLLKNCQPELSMVPAFNNVGERSTAKNYYHLLSVVIKSLKTCK